MFGDGQVSEQRRKSAYREGGMSEGTDAPRGATAGAPITLTPVRVQRRRVKGWRMPENTVFVGRGTVFGNALSTCTLPHNCALRPCACCDDATDGRNWCCVSAYREYLTSGVEGRPSTTGLFRYALDAMAGYPTRTKLVARLPALRGKNLACWCALDQPCHADVLLELANASAPIGP